MQEEQKTNITKDTVDTKIIIIGPSAVGKSTIVKAIAGKLGLSVIDGELEFDTKNHIPSETNPVTKKFISVMQKHNVLAILPDTATPVPVTASMLRNKDTFRNTDFGRFEDGVWVSLSSAYDVKGEKAFRLYEEMVLKNLMENGKLSGDSLVITSSAAFTRESNLEVATKNGYHFLILDVPDIMAYNNLWRDYQAYRQDGVSRRGTYEKNADKAYNLAITDGEEAANNAACNALASTYDEITCKRKHIFNSLVKDRSGTIITVEEGERPEDVANRVLLTMKKIYDNPFAYRKVTFTGEFSFVSPNEGSKALEARLAGLRIDREKGL